MINCQMNCVGCNCRLGSSEAELSADHSGQEEEMSTPWRSGRGTQKDHEGSWKQQAQIVRILSANTGGLQELLRQVLECPI